MILRGWCGSPNMSATAIRNGLLFGTNDNSWDQSKLSHETNNHEPGQFLLWFEVEDTGCGMVQFLFVLITFVIFSFTFESIVYGLCGILTMTTFSGYFVLCPC